MYEVTRKRDGKAVSIPCSLRIAEGIRDYLESVTNEKYLIIDLTPVSDLYTRILSGK